MKKRIQALVMSIVLILSMSVSSVVFANNNVTVKLNGETLTFDVPPQIINGRTMVPLRKIFESLGAVVTWEGAQQRIQAVTEDCHIIATVGNNTLTVSKEEVQKVELDVPPTVINGRTLVPARFIAEALGAKVEWDGSTQTVNIYSDKIPAVKPSTLIYSDSQVGHLTGTITYQYNKYVGTKADVGARVMLIQTNHVPLYSDGGAFLLFKEIGFNDPMIHCTEVDGMGNYYLDNIPAGYYYLLVLSEETNESPEMEEMNKGLARNYLQGKITAEALERLELNLSLHSFEFETIEIKPNQTTRFSHDFGYTYFAY